MSATIEYHPFSPFLPEGARLLMLGTFPPAEKRWSMRFYYPNFQNDMWRIMGLCFFGDKSYFVDAAHKTFRLETLKSFLVEQGIALYDTATAIVRTKNTASDKDLQVVEATDITALLREMPHCRAVVTAGQLATTLCARHFHIAEPRVGQHTPFVLSVDGRPMRLYRMPSSSRAYPMSADDKAACYRPMFHEALQL